MPTPGLFLVNSAITQPQHLTPDTFSAWYEKEHIPDILATSGISSASRYKATDPSSTRPYLALYPVTDLSWLESDEFKSVPVHSDAYLPKDEKTGQKGCIFSYAVFDTRHYEKLEERGDAGSRPAGYLLSVCSERGLGEAPVPEGSGLVRVRHYKLTSHMSLPPPPDKATDPAGYLSLYEFEKKGPAGDLADALLEGADGTVEIREFKLLAAFGDEDAKL